MHADYFESSQDDPDSTVSRCGVIAGLGTAVGAVAAGGGTLVAVTRESRASIVADSFAVSDKTFEQSQVTPVIDVSASHLAGRGLGHSAMMQYFGWSDYQVASRYIERSTDATARQLSSLNSR